MPIRPVAMPTLPYVGSGALGDLLRLRGDRSGQMWAQLGQTISSGLQQHAQEQREAPIRAQQAEIQRLNLENAQAEQATRQQGTAREQAIQQFEMSPEFATMPTEAKLSGYIKRAGPTVGRKYFDTWFASTQAPIEAEAKRLERESSAVKATRDAASAQLGNTPLGAPIPASQFATSVQAGVPTGRFEYGSPGDVPMLRNGQPNGAMPPMVTNAGTPEQILAQQQEQRLSVPKPPAPPAVGSFEDFVVRKFGTAPTPEQITAARKEYNQSDDRPRDPLVHELAQARLEALRASGLPPATQRRVDSKSRSFEALPVVKKAQTMSEAVGFAQALDQNTTNASDDQALIYAFAKAMDPDSVVREGEYATVQKYAQSWAKSQGFNAARIFSDSPFLSPAARKNMKATITTKFDAAKKQYDAVRKSYTDQINAITKAADGDSYLTDFGAAFPAPAEAKSAGDDGWTTVNGVRIRPRVNP